MSVLSCCTPCPTVQSVQVPGSEGPAGLDGTSGVNAYTRTTAAFVLPAPMADVTVVVESAVWMVIGQILIMGVGYDAVGSGPAHFKVTALPSAITATLQYLNSAGDLATGNTISAGSTVSPSA